MMGFGAMEILLVFLLVIFFFGAKKIPVIMKGVGSGIRNFKGEINKPEEAKSEDTLDSPSDNDESY
jgi:sec-independent protein translocase protein TatA